MNFPITNHTVDQFLARQTTKGRRRVIWNPYTLGTYIKSKHGLIGTPKHNKIK